MRTPHYWRKAGAKSAPQNVLVFDCETHHGSAVEDEVGELQTLRLGCALAYRREGTRRSRVAELTFRTPPEFWDFVLSRLDKRRPLWVFAHNAPFDLGCVDGWRWLTGGWFKCEKAAVSGTLFYLKGEVNKCGLVFCDTINYWRSSLKEVGKSVGVEKMEMPKYEESDDVWERYCRNDVMVTAACIDKLRDFNREHMLGPWALSIAGLSFTAYRSAFLKEKVLVHSYPAPLRLERDCYYGGVVDTPHVGDVIRGPVHELDVCSMYPAVCLRPLPIRFRHDGRRYGLSAVRSLSERHMLAAEVEVDSPTDPYPVRMKRGTYFATGRFRTSLAHPELMRAVERGHVKYVHYLCYYDHAPVFREYMEFFTSLKIKYDTPDTKAMRTLAKMYNTNLYGKTGQLSPQWRQWDAESLGVLEEKWGLGEGALERWYGRPPDLYQAEETFRFPGAPEPVEVRDYYGVVEVKCGETESRESCPIIAATVTSYARCLLRGYQETAGSGHWFYSDTDSIWVDSIGLANLEAAGCVRNNELGYLSLKDTHDWLIVHAPKDYETNLTLKRKGVRSDAKPTEKGGWSQLQFPSAMEQMKDGLRGAVYVRRIEKRLHRTLNKVKLLPGGFTRPLVFPEENPERH